MVGYFFTHPMGFFIFCRNSKSLPKATTAPKNDKKMELHYLDIPDGSKSPWPRHETDIFWQKYFFYLEEYSVRTFSTKFQVIISNTFLETTNSKLQPEIFQIR